MNVSTRPRKAATAVTTPPSPLPAPEDWRPAAIAARDAVSQLVFEAQGLDANERDDSCGFAKRLMVMAVSEIGETNTSAPQDEFEAAAFNTEALINGALDLTADRVGPQAEAHLRHALVILDKLTKTTSGGKDVGPIWSAIRSKPSKPAATMGQRHCPPAPSEPQYGLVLERTEEQLRVLRNLISIAQSGEDEWVKRNALDGAYEMVTMMGALASSTGGIVLGSDPHAWLYGPSFADEGKAVQA